MSTKCPKCHATNHASATECTLCGVQFADLNRERGLKTTSKNVKYCEWNDHGKTCDFRGIISSTTNGDGAFYCREHWQKLNKWPDLQIVGNGLPAYTESHAAREMRVRAGKVAVARAGPLVPAVEWMEGEQYNSLKQRVRDKAGTPAPRQREPGDDDEEIAEQEGIW